MTATNRLEVMQADRDAAADIWRDYVARIGEVMAEKAIRSGAMDDGSLVQTFVAHRIETNSRTGDIGEGVGVAATPPLSHPSGRAQEVSGKAGIANAGDAYREIAETLRDELEATYVGADADLKGSLGESYIAFGAACARRAVKALTQCTCGEVAGEDPWCTQHGRGTEWAADSQERGI